MDRHQGPLSISGCANKHLPRLHWPCSGRLFGYRGEASDLLSNFSLGLPFFKRAFILAEPRYYVLHGFHHT